MRIARFLTANAEARSGRVDDEGRVFAFRDDVDDDWACEAEPTAISEFLAPLDPVNILAIGRNFRAHAAETGSTAPEQPLVFCKPTTSVIGPGDRILLPRSAPNEVDYEAELAIVIGRAAKNVSEAEAMDYVFGFTCANDVSARDCQRNDKQWTRAKGFDTFCPLGPWIVSADEFDYRNCRIRSRLNGQLMQDAPASEMVHSCPAVVSWLSRQFTLVPGTVILTGTPSGVGTARTPPVYMKPGDEIEIEIVGIGSLVNVVAAE